MSKNVSPPQLLEILLKGFGYSGLIGVFVGILFGMFGYENRSLSDRLTGVLLFGGLAALFCMVVVALVALVIYFENKPVYDARRKHYFKTRDEQGKLEAEKLNSSEKSESGGDEEPVESSRENSPSSRVLITIKSDESAKRPRWEVIFQQDLLSKTAFLTPREFYFLLILCHERLYNINRAMPRELPVSNLAVESLPDSISKLLTEGDPFAWFKKPPDAERDIDIGNQQSKMQGAINDKLKRPIIELINDCYSLIPEIAKEDIHLPDNRNISPE